MAAGHSHSHGHDPSHSHAHSHSHDHGHGRGEGGKDHAMGGATSRAPAAEHRARGPASVPCYALTVSDSRTAADDTGGRTIREVLEEQGHTVVGSAIVKDDADAIRTAIQAALARGARVVITTGGTGLTSRDVTPEAIAPLVVRPIPGFGELFRLLSWEQVGSAAMLSRATAAVIQGNAVLFALPGSPAGVRLAMERLVAPELPHLMEQLSR